MLVKQNFKKSKKNNQNQTFCYKIFKMIMNNTKKTNNKMKSFRLMQIFCKINQKNICR